MFLFAYRRTECSLFSCVPGRNRRNTPGLGCAPREALRPQAHSRKEPGLPRARRARRPVSFQDGLP